VSRVLIVQTVLANGILDCNLALLIVYSDLTAVGEILYSWQFLFMVLLLKGSISLYCQSG